MLWHDQLRRQMGWPVLRSRAHNESSGLPDYASLAEACKLARNELTQCILRCLPQRASAARFGQLCPGAFAMRSQTLVRPSTSMVGFPLYSWDNSFGFASEVVLSESFLPLIEGFMPLQFLLEIATTLFLLGGLAILLERAEWRVGLFTKAVVVFLVILFWLKYRIYPPVPSLSRISPLP